MSKNIFVSLDIGETYIKAVAMNYFSSKLAVIASTMVKTNGVTNGDITNSNDLTLSIKEALSNIKSQDENINTNEILLVLPSSKMTVYRKKVSMDIVARDHIITSKDLRSLKFQFAKEKQLDETIVNIIPLFYRIDGGEPIYKDISGMSATKIELEANIITLPTFIARSYVDIVQNIGCEILDAVVSPIALNSILVNKNDANNGKIIADFGGKNTLLSYFQNGNLVSTSLIRFGSNLITSEICKQFDISYEKSDQLKKEFGNANSHLSDQIPVYIDDSRGLSITEKDLSEIISKRLDEYYIELSKQCGMMTKNINYPIVLIGGGSHLKLLDEQIKTRLVRDSNTYISSFVGARNNAFLPCIGIINYYVSMHK